MVLAASAARVVSIDGGYMVEDDPDGLATDAERSRELGFDAKLTVFPRHVSLVRTALGRDRAAAPITVMSGRRSVQNSNCRSTVGTGRVHCAR